MQGGQQEINRLRIDPKGIFKYILIEGKSNAVISRYVRGSVKYEYHAQNFVAFKEELEQLGYKIEGYNKQAGRFTAKKGDRVYTFKCRGGGRIQHNYNDNKCHIYGYSKSYGHVDHNFAKQLICKHLGYKEEEVTETPEGY